MKVTNNVFYALLVLGLVPSTLFADGDKKEATTVVNCPQKVGEFAEVTCSGSATVNAIGDPITIDVSKVPVTDLGKITAEKAVDITLPQTPGTQTVYSLTPSTGESKDKKLLIVFDYVKQRPGTRLFGQTLIQIYRQFDDAKDKTKWTEVGQIKAPVAEIKTKPVKITLKPDGTAVWTGPKGPEVFPISQKYFTEKDA